MGANISQGSAALGFKLPPSDLLLSASWMSGTGGEGRSYLLLQVTKEGERGKSINSDLWEHVYRTFHMSWIRVRRMDRHLFISCALSRMASVGRGEVASFWSVGVIQWKHRTGFVFAHHTEHSLCRCRFFVWLKVLPNNESEWVIII